MSHIVELVSFNLKKDVSVPDFLLVSDKFNQDFMSGQKGYISRKLLVKGDTWTDLVLWESIEDAKNAAKNKKSTVGTPGKIMPMQASNIQSTAKAIYKARMSFDE